MAYNKTTWENAPSTNSPINASNLNKIEEGIYQNSLKADQVGDLSELETVNKTNTVNAINEVLSTLDIIDISNKFTSNFNIQKLVAIYIPKLKVVIMTFYVTSISGSGETTILSSSNYNPNMTSYDTFYGIAGSTCYGSITPSGIKRLVGNSGLMCGTTMFTVN